MAVFLTNRLEHLIINNRIHQCLRFHMKLLEAVVVFCEKGVKKVKKTLAQVFFYEFCEISKNTFLHRTPLLAASELFKLKLKELR